MAVVSWFLRVIKDRDFGVTELDKQMFVRLELLLSKVSLQQCWWLFSPRTKYFIQHVMILPETCKCFPKFKLCTWGGWSWDGAVL